MRKGKLEDEKVRRIVTILALILCAAQLIIHYSQNVSDSDQEKILLEGAWITGQRTQRHECYDQCEGTDELVYFSYGRGDYIDAYDLTGTYQYTIHLPEDSQNGSILIDCRDGFLYAQSKGDTLYLFRGQELLERMDRAAAKERDLLLRYGDEDSDYVLTDTHVARVEGDSLTPLFPIPPEVAENLPSFTIPDNVIWGLLVALFALGVVGISGFALWRIRWYALDRKKWNE